MHRRQFIQTSLLGTAAFSIPPLLRATADAGQGLGVTDWTIGGMAKLEALDLAAEIGLNGIQASILPEPGEGQYDLRNRDAQKALLEKSAATGVTIASTGMGIFNKRPFKEVPEAVGWAKDGVKATAALERRVMLLAFFGKNNLKDDPSGIEETIKRLKQVAPVAEENNVILGLETTLNVDEHLHILDSVNSPSVQVYYDTGNMKGAGYDINAEIRKLGRERICEVHLKDNGGGVFGEGDVDFPAASTALNEIGFNDWFILEGKAGKGMTMLETLAKNAAYLKSIDFV